MKFFIPDIQDTKKAEKLFKSIQAFTKKTLGWSCTDRRIFRISYYHNSIYYEAEVGKKSEVNNEHVIAILESHTYLICTPTRGVLGNMPILVGKHDTISTEDFEI